MCDSTRMNSIGFQDVLLLKVIACDSYERSLAES